LFVESGQQRVVQLVLMPTSPDVCELQLFSRAGDDDGSSWTRHVSGRMTRVNGSGRQPERIDLDDLQRRCCEEIGGSGFYQAIARPGVVELGPGFRWLETIRRRDGEAVCRLRTADAAERAAFELHPGLIDSAFQALNAAIGHVAVGESEPISA